jgi:hypothetical protein
MSGEKEGLYLTEGWLNFDYIEKKPAWLIVIIGKRQVGKTYGALQCMLRKGYQHILLRRTTAELDTIAATPDLNPYKVFEPEFHVGLFKQAKKLCRICEWAPDPEGKAIPGEQLGIATSLAEIAHIRGFSGRSFTDLVFDEFIPEKGVITRKTEGEAFLNAYVTINGNRELEGLPPLRAWLLANTNRIDSPILEALNISDDILYMRRKGKEEFLTDSGVYILQPDSTKVIEARADTALMKQISKKSEFYGMAMENEFSYDESPYIKTIPIKHLEPLWSYNDQIYCWKRSGGYYICRAPFRAAYTKRYDGTKTDREKLNLDYPWLKPYYYAGMILFSDLRVLSIFKQIFNID